MVTMSAPLAPILGDRVAEPLEQEFGLRTAEDLVRYYPTRYVSRGQELVEDNPEDGQHVTVVGRIVEAKLRQSQKKGLWLLNVELSCSGRSVKATFFNGRRSSHHLKVGRRVMFSGNVKYYKSTWSLAHPAYVVLADSDDDRVAPAESGGRVKAGGAYAGLARGSAEGGFDPALFDLPLVPMYPASKAVETWTFLACVRQVLDVLDVLDPLPEQIRDERGIIGLSEALHGIHFPENESRMQAARDRLRFDEAVSLQLVLAQRRARRRASASRPAAPRADGIAAAFDDRLPFELTAGQRMVAGEIADDLSRDHPMSRMLQGEVGSGKTIVAMRAMLQVVDAGMQCALLAPTEVLAAQHYRSVTGMLGPLGTGGELGSDPLATKVVLLTGSMSTAAKRAALLDVVSGEAGIVIGTHALIQDTVEFFDLGLVVIDEQHRFGVEQRDALRAKARDGAAPHLLVMTATPIPRTIAMTTLGDLETSTLRELPRGRSPISTTVVATRVHASWVDRAWMRIREEVAAGRQAYVVCSRIGDDLDALPRGDDSRAPTTAPAVDLHEQQSPRPQAGRRVGLRPGRRPAHQKDQVMREFTAGQIDVLVSTTVIEVGVDVPNATTMVILDADRFGVSQLHQLRGRVGRGAHAGLCLLVTDAAPDGAAHERLTAVAATTDGFELALLDLRTRREGDVLGAAQSGTKSTLRLLSLLDDAPIVEAAHDYASTVIGEDPELERHPGLAGMAAAAVDDRRADYLTKS